MPTSARHTINGSINIIDVMFQTVFPLIGYIGFVLNHIVREYDHVLIYSRAYISLMAPR